MKKCFIFFILSFFSITFCFANPPSRLWRVDGRPPSSAESIFFNGFQAYGTNYNLFDHTFGVSNIAAEAEGTVRNDGYISTSSSRQAAIEFLEERLESQLFRAGRSYWLYEIIPSSNAYSFETTVLDGIERHETGEQPLSATDISALREFERSFFSMQEWMVADAIQRETILSATELIVDARGNIQQGQTIQNPWGVISTPAPNSQAAPLGGSTDPEDPSILDSLPNGLVAAAASFFLCTQSQLQPRAVNLSSSSKCRELNNIPARIKEKDALNKLKQQQGKDIKFVFRVRNGKNYCLANTNNFPSLDFCDKGLKLRYSTNGLIETKINNRTLCVSMPNGYSQSNFKWGYLQFKICAINDPSQRWDIIRPKNAGWYIQHQTTKLKISEYDWTLMVGKSGYEGYGLVFASNASPDVMPKSFYFGSLGYDQNHWLSINWKGPRNILWYPDGYGFSSSTPIPTYYDKETKLWRILKNGQLYCIRSARQYTKMGILDWWGDCTKVSSDPKAIWYFNRSVDPNLKEIYYTAINQAGERLVIDTKSTTFNWNTIDKSETVFGTDSHFLVSPNIFN